MINKAASVRARLLNMAKAERRDFSQVLTRYGLERLLYRLSVSSGKDNFLLKGALLFDIGYGDAVTPAPELAVYPVMLEDMPAPKIRIYPRYTVVAEKFEAIVTLGMANSRLKDYFDLWVILTTQELEPTLIQSAIKATLDRRRTPMPHQTPIGLTHAFGSDPQKIKQWQAFVNKNRLQAPDLNAVIELLQQALIPQCHDPAQMQSAQPGI